MGDESRPSYFLQSMSEELWEMTDDGVVARFQPWCRICDSRNLAVRKISLLNFPLDMTRPEEENSYAVDVEYQCHECGWTATHGVAIDRAHYLTWYKANQDFVRRITLSTAKKEMWEKTHDAQGLKANFKIVCFRCKEEMLYRNSLMGSETLGGNTYNSSIMVFRVCFKCPHCRMVEVFYIPVERVYYAEVLDYRKGRVVHYPPIAQWEENEIVRKRLESLGYV